MTHDELLARLDELKYDVGDSGMNEEYKAIYALRAVVELAGKLQDQDPFHEDAGWNAGYNYAMYEVIQAIQEQLK